MRLSEEEDFLDLLYGAAVQPDLWVHAIERFADLVGGTSVWLARLSVVDGLGAAVLGRIDPAMAAAYLDHFAGVNPLNNVDDPGAYAANWRPAILTDEDWMAKEDLVATDYYNDFLAPYDVHSTLMIRLALRDREVCALNVNRPRGREQFGGPDMERARRLHPHLIRAYHLSEKLAIRPEAGGKALPTVPETRQGLLLLNREGRVQHMNRAANRVVGSGVGLEVRQGRLALGRPDMNLRLQALVAAAGSPNYMRRTGGSIAVSGPARCAPTVLTVAPAPAGAMELFGAGPAIIVTIEGPHPSAGMRSEQRLRDDFGLTPAEIRVALALSEGISPRQAADKLGVSIHTVRHQLQSVFEKTGASRQTELVKLLLERSPTTSD